MNDNQTTESGKVVVLKIRLQFDDIERNFPVAIRVVGEMEAGKRPFVGSVEPAAARARNP